MSCAQNWSSPFFYATHLMFRNVTMQSEFKSASQRDRNGARVARHQMFSNVTMQSEYNSGSQQDRKVARVVLVGVGTMGRIRAAAMSSNPRLKLCGIVDILPWSFCYKEETSFLTWPFMMWTLFDGHSKMKWNRYLRPPRILRNSWKLMEYTIMPPWFWSSQKVRWCLR